MAEQRADDVHDYEDIADLERRMMSGDANLKMGRISWSRDDLHWRNNAHTPEDR